MKTKIIKKSYELFMEKGFEKVSVNEIIKSLDISKGGFYHYFNSKDDLLEEITLIHSDSMLALLRKVDTTKFDKSSEVINYFYQKILNKKLEDVFKRAIMEEKLLAKDNIKLLLKIKNKIVKQRTDFYAEVFINFGVEHPLEVAEVWVESNSRINRLVHKAITRKDYIDENILKKKLIFYEKLFGHLIGEEDSIILVDPIMEHMRACKNALEVKKDD